ncbi:YiiX/YebB-like N1pC/P60 family cysteine hydrolase [Taibaiella koreensis]|uniref:YiiX/YebB-like N1pC/P60 family cysteine hydrolase n=1 Tax=Taibaiella koreensis TaxID=1268548 RepID=UPI000E59FE52|nr:YiiX/YebB-like N1pC/P60 family cysteine hydrolase [Taibaiella koreensis]
MKRLLLLALVSFTISASAQPGKDFSWQTGDLIFQDLDCGEMCDAIEAVTQGYEGKAFSHVGLVDREGDSVMVIEALGKGVQMIPLETFTRRTEHKMYVGRVKPEYKKLVEKAMAFAKQQLGKPYDDAFLYDNGKYYCSELIYDAFKQANKGKPFFRLEPMTFKEPGSGAYFPVWIKYYRQLGVDIPEGKPGCNPGGLSRSDKISIVGTI